MPPSTAAVNAIRPSWKPVSYRLVPIAWMYSTPAAPASAPPRAKVNEIVRLTLMPISRAASWSWAVARIALPCRVLVTM